MWTEVLLSLYFFAMDIQNIRIVNWKEYSLTTMFSSQLTINFSLWNQLTCMSASSLSSVPIWPAMIFMPVPHYLYYCTFTINLPTLFSFKILLGTLGWLYFHMNIRVSLVNFYPQKKCPLGLSWDLQIEHWKDILAILNLFDPWTWYISQFLCPP